jgi:hypothetical protein
MKPRYWIGVVSASHVARGVEGGFAQLCHGKAAPLQRMKPGDWLVYYSPKTAMEGGEPLQCFTAIGKVVGDRVYPFQMRPDFTPYRIDIAYLKSRNAPIHPLLPRLSFIKDPKRWGYPFRRGQIEMSRDDCGLIAEAMGVSLDAAT